MSPTFRSLRNPNYRRYVIGSVVSNTGTWMQRVAQDWLVLSLGGGGAALGITTGLQFLPVLALSPYAGVIADRFPKRRLLQITQAMMAVSALALGLIAVLGVAEIWHVYVLAFVFGIGSAFDAPARQSFVSEMVDPEDVTNAVGLNSAGFNVARILGPGLAGLMIGLLGGGAEATGWVILINAVSYLAVIWQLEQMDTALLHTSEPRPRTPGMLREGIRYVGGQPKMVLILIMVFFAGTFGMNFQITSALMATEEFGKGAGEFGLLGSAMAVGALIAALLAARRVTIRLRLLVFAAVGFGAAEIVAAMLPTYVAFMLFAPAHRLLHPDPAQLRQRHPAARVGPRVPGPGDGALHDHRDGRHPARIARDRVGRGTSGRPVDVVDRWRADHRWCVGGRGRVPAPQQEASRRCSHRFDPADSSRVASILVSGTTRPLRVPA